jgi:hypothetical protein
MPARYKPIQFRRGLSKALAAENRRLDAESAARAERVLESPLVYADGLLPTLPGCTHGVVGVDPLRFQCDRCGAVASAADMPKIIAAQFATFDFPMTGDPRRLCDVCREARWVA